MNRISGNVNAVIQVKTTDINEIGERISAWTDTQTLRGYLDMAAGDAKRMAYNAKVVESTHVFLCDYVPLAENVNTEDCRMLIGSDKYDITYIDDPMGLHYHLEIFLKFTGGIVNG